MAPACEPAQREVSPSRSSATDTPAEGVAYRVVDSLGVKTVETLNPELIEAKHRWTLASEPDVRIGSSDDPVTALAGVKAIAYGPNGQIIVPNDQTFEIKAFSATGEPLWTQGRIGDGPGEYRGFRSAEYCSGKIVATDLQLRRLTLLDIEGRIVAPHDWSPLRRRSIPFRFDCDRSSGVSIHMDREVNPPSEIGKRIGLPRVRVSTPIRRLRQRDRGPIGSR